MKKIGFIDFYLSEWHANNYPGWIKESCEKTGKEFTVAYAWAELDQSPSDGMTSAEWCRKFGCELCGSIEEVCEKSDYIIILSPDNPEKHLSYAERVLKFGKPTYIDKTFAPDLETAKKIFKLAKEYKTPMFSASALGFADELKFFASPVKSVISTGGGGALERYCVHQLEMIVTLMGCGAKRAIAACVGENTSVSIDYGDGRAAVLNYSPSYDFSVSIDNGKEVKFTPIRSEFFKNLIKSVLELFETGIPALSREHTLEVMAVRDGVLKAQKNRCEWVKI